MAGTNASLSLANQTIAACNHLHKPIKSREEKNSGEQGIPLTSIYLSLSGGTSVACKSRESVWFSLEFVGKDTFALDKLFLVFSVVDLKLAFDLQESESCIPSEAPPVNQINNNIKPPNARRVGASPLELNKRIRSKSAGFS